LMRSVVLDDVAAKVERQDVVRRQRAERRPEAIHQHAIGRDHDTYVAGIGHAQPSTKENARRAADVELELVNVNGGWGCGCHADLREAQGLYRNCGKGKSESLFQYKMSLKQGS